MADIVIRGYKMPCNCGGCEFFFENSLGAKWCEIKFTPTEEAGRPSWCPLIALPEGHGRLVDGEVLYKKFVELEQQAMSYVKARDGEEWKMWAAILTERTAFKFDVVDAPTIVPAEEDEK